MQPTLPSNDKVHITSAGEMSTLVSVCRVILSDVAWCGVAECTSVCVCICVSVDWFWFYLLCSLTVFTHYLKWNIVLLYVCVKVEVLEHEDRTNNSQQNVSCSKL